MLPVLVAVYFFVCLFVSSGFPPNTKQTLISKSRLRPEIVHERIEPLSRFARKFPFFFCTISIGKQWFLGEFWIISRVIFQYCPKISDLGNFEILQEVLETMYYLFIQSSEISLF